MDEKDMETLEKFSRVEKGFSCTEGDKLRKLSFYDFTLVHVVFAKDFLNNSSFLQPSREDKSKVRDENWGKLRHEIWHTI